MTHLRLYLDNNDYSLMSDPRRSTSEIAETLEQLRAWVRDGTVICYFTGGLLSEMAPVGSGVSPQAERRWDLLLELCGRNALISHDRLYEYEIRLALTGDRLPQSVYSHEADWFPGGVDEFLRSFDLLAQIKDHIAEGKPDRAERRRREREFFKKGTIKPSVRAGMIGRARRLSDADMLGELPIKAEHWRTLARFFLGDVPYGEARAALVESLSDPRWMLQWFSTRDDARCAFTEWMRGPARTLMPFLEAMYASAQDIRALDRNAGTKLASELLAIRAWESQQDRALLNLVSRFATELLKLDCDALTVDLVNRHCLGLSTGVRAFHSAVRMSTTETPRDVSKLRNDLPDALHAMYAPYVDFFRADGFMAPHVGAAVKRHGSCVVVPKLSELLPAIKARLN